MAVVTTEVDGSIGTIWLDRAEKLNAMGNQFWVDLPNAVAELEENPNVRVIVVLAKGRHFSVGLDLMESPLPLGEDRALSQAAAATKLYRRIKELQNAISSLDSCRKPTIAGVHGYCIGGGVDLISSCNMRLATTDATFSVREAKIAIVADIGSLQRLPQIIPKGILYELALTARDFSAKEAQEWGLVNRVVDNVDQLQAACVKLANEIADNSPLATMGTKEILDGVCNRNLSQDLDRVALWNSAFIESHDLKEAVAAFIEKRPATFKGD